jgi:class 3 adenylate cyclase
VLFGDLVGFTSLSEHRDQEEVRELLTRYFDECRQIIARYGGTVEKFIGDAVMAVWGVPTAHEDDAERSVRAGLELVNTVAAMGEDVGAPGLAMRAGIVTGEVAVTVGAQQQGMVAGDPVNTASRVQSVAAPGQVWVDETTRLLTSSAITYVDVGSHLLKGKTEPVPLWSVRAVVAAVGGAQRADGLEAPLVGRDRELRLVKELFHAADEGGHPALVVVDGDPGVGKSRLAWEFEKYVDGLSTQVRWHSGRCLAYGDGVAFYALADAVRGRLQAEASELEGEQGDDVDLGRLIAAGLDRHVADPDERGWLQPRLAALLGSGSMGSFDREDLFSAWVTFLERVGAGEETVVLVVEDAQNADEGLLEFIEHLLAVGSFRCLVLMLSRPGLLDAHPALATNRRSTVVHLPTLSEADMSKLLGGLVAGLPDDVRSRLVERAEGVPLFAVETVRSLIDRDLVVPRGGQYVLADPEALDLDAVGAPATLQALISARLDMLSTEQRRVVDRASVLGESFRKNEMMALCVDVPELDRVLGELVRLQILSRESSRLSAEFGQFRFVQSVVRQVAYSTLARRDRKDTHLAVIDMLLAEEDAGEDLAPIIAQHYLEALEAVPGGDDVAELQRLAIAQLERAAARAGALGSPREAAGHLASALRNAADDATRARLRSELAARQFLAGRYAEAAENAAQATAAFDELGDEAAAALAAARHAEALGTGLGDNEQALAVAEPRWTSLRGREGAEEALLALGQAITGSRLRLSRDIRDCAEEQLRLAGRVGAGSAEADALIALSIHFTNAGLPTLSRLLLREGAEMARAQHRPTVLARALINLTVEAMAESVARAVEYGREALDVAMTTGAPSWLEFARANLALALLEQGDWDALDAVVAAQYGDSEKIGPVVSVAISVGAVVREARAKPWTLPWSSDARPQFDDMGAVAWLAHCEALAARAEGRLRDAVGLAMEALRNSFSVMGHYDDFPYLWDSAADIVLQASDAHTYAELVGLAGGADDRVPLPLVGHRDRVAGLWLMRTDPDSPLVESRLRAGLEAYERWGSVLHRARTEADLGVWLTANGRGDEAVALLDRARAAFSEMGASAWLERLEDRLLVGG